MKRKIADLVNWVPVWERHKELITSVFFVVVYCIVGIYWLSLVDILPATAEDYKPLIESAKNIQKNPSLLLEYEWANGKNMGNILTISFKNDECNLIAQYDKDFVLLSTTKKDKALSFGELIVLIISITVVSFILTALFVVVMSVTVDRKKEIKSRIREAESEQEDGEEEQE